MSHPHPSENPSVPFPCPQNEMEHAAFLHPVPTYMSYLSPGVSSCPGRKWVEKAFLIYWMTKTEICFLLITQMLSISWPRSDPGRVRIEDLYQDAATCWIKDGTCCPNPRSPPVQFSSVLSLSRVRLFVTPWTAICQTSLSITNSRSPPKLMSIESVMPSNHLILCCPLLHLPSTFPSIRVFSNESALRIRWPKYWSFSLKISPSNEHPGLISFRMDWLDLLAPSKTSEQTGYFISVSKIFWRP